MTEEELDNLDKNLPEGVRRSLHILYRNVGNTIMQLIDDPNNDLSLGSSVHNLVNYISVQTRKWKD